MHQTSHALRILVPCSVPCFEQFLSSSLLSWTAILTFNVGTHYFTLILYEHLCHMLIPYGILFAPHLHDKEKREKRRRKGMKQNKKTFVVAKVLL